MSNTTGATRSPSNTEKAWAAALFGLPACVLCLTLLLLVGYNASTWAIALYGSTLLVGIFGFEYGWRRGHPLTAGAAFVLLAAATVLLGYLLPF